MERFEELNGKLKGLDDKTLAELITKAADAVGLSEKEKNTALNHLPMVRNKLNRATPREIGKALGKLGEKNTAELMEVLKKNGK